MYLAVEQDSPEQPLEGLLELCPWQDSIGRQKLAVSLDSKSIFEPVTPLNLIPFLSCSILDSFPKAYLTWLGIMHTHLLLRCGNPQTCFLIWSLAPGHGEVLSKCQALEISCQNF